MQPPGPLPLCSTICIGLINLKKCGTHNQSGKVVSEGLGSFEHVHNDLQMENVFGYLTLTLWEVTRLRCLRWEAGPGLPADSTTFRKPIRAGRKQWLAPLWLLALEGLTRAGFELATLCNLEVGQADFVDVWGMGKASYSAVAVQMVCQGRHKSINLELGAEIHQPLISQFYFLFEHTQ